MGARIKTIFSNCVWILSYAVTLTLSRLLGSVSVSYHDPSIASLKGPVILMSNHKGSLDPWLISSSLPVRSFFRLLPIRPFATTKFSDTNTFSRRLQKMGVISLVYYLYNVITVPVSDSTEEKVDPLVAALNRGETVLLFPEGRIEHDDTVREFKKGVVRVQERSGALILPCAIRYIRRGFIFYKIHVAFGAPVRISEELDVDHEEHSYHKAREFLRSKTEALYNISKEMEGSIQ